MNMNSVVLLGTAHPIQRGENHPDAFRAVLIEVRGKYKVKAIAEEMKNGINTVASKLAADLDLRQLHADPDNNERVDGGIESDCRLDIVRKYEDRYPQIRIWPRESGDTPSRVFDIAILSLIFLI